MRLLKNEINRFLLVGITTVIIDLSAYSFLLFLELDTYISKGISFNIGALFAFYANKNFTFKSNTKSPFKFILFLILYLATLSVNVSLNEKILSYIGKSDMSLFIAFVIATAMSATINFLGMKYIVFKSNNK